MIPESRGHSRLCARVPHMWPAAVAGRQLAARLRRLGVPAVVTGEGAVTLVSVWTDLWIWVGHKDGRCWFWWWTGRRTPGTGARVYAHHAVDDPTTAARRISIRYLEVREQYPSPCPLKES